MATKENTSVYYVPESSWFPIGMAFAAFLFVSSLAVFLNNIAGGLPITFYIGAIGLAIVFFSWFYKITEESQQGLPNDQLRYSYVLGMYWFIFSEVMFFLGFFGALFYIRVFSLDWLGGEGDKFFTGEYLWPNFEAIWPVMSNPGAAFTAPMESMAAPSTLSAWLYYLPFWNTLILLSSSVTIHFAHESLKQGKLQHLIYWMFATVGLGIIFLILQVEEYIHAYEVLGLTLDSGIYGSTFFLLTGFHGFHVTLGTTMLVIQLILALRKRLNPEQHFGFEATAWYWHFVDVVWVCLFFFVYIF